MSTRIDVTEAELDVLKTLWEHGPSTIREVCERLPSSRAGWAYTTVQTLLSRLRDKGVVDRQSKETPHVYLALVSRDQMLRFRLQDMTRTICDGATSPVVSALIKGARLSPRDIKQLRELIDELDEGSRSKRKAK